MLKYQRLKQRKTFDDINFGNRYLLSGVVIPVHKNYPSRSAPRRHSYKFIFRKVKKICENSNLCARILARMSWEFSEIFGIAIPGNNRHRFPVNKERLGSINLFSFFLSLPTLGFNFCLLFKGWAV